MRPAPDLTGQVFGRLTAVSKIQQPGKAQWRCICICGVAVVAKASPLQQGFTKSCGCLGKEAGEAMRVKVEDLSKSCYGKTYRSWGMMMQRCYNPNATGYEYYGARGIGVSPEWRVFSKFLADIGERPEGTSLDRLDTNGGYSRDNCKWSTRAEQARNKRSNVKIACRGLTVCLKDAAKLAGVPYHTAKARLYNGHSVEDALGSAEFQAAH